MQMNGDCFISRCSSGCIMGRSLRNDGLALIGRRSYQERLHLRMGEGAL